MRRGGLWIALAGILFAQCAHAEEFCNWRPRQIEDPTDVRGTTLLLVTDRETLGIYNNCVTILRRQFGSILNFALVNRFPEGTSATSAYALVKSTRLLSSSPPVKITLSRGKGWILPGTDGKVVPQGEFSRPYRGSIEDWNKAHDSLGTPEEISQRLRVPWHSYATADLGLSSTDYADFWKIDPSFDRMHSVSTHYLLRFDVNTGRYVSNILFQVALQPEVDQIRLNIQSSMESLSGEFKFMVR